MMIKAQKWHPKQRKYTLIDLPDAAVAYSEDMGFLWTDEKVACAECGEIHNLGDCIGSKLIKNENGNEYLICPDCFEKEKLEES